MEEIIILVGLFILATEVIFFSTLLTKEDDNKKLYFFIGGIVVYVLFEIVLIIYVQNSTSYFETIDYTIYKINKLYKYLMILMFILLMILKNHKKSTLITGILIAFIYIVLSLVIRFENIMDTPDIIGEYQMTMIVEEAVNLPDEVNESNRETLLKFLYENQMSRLIVTPIIIYYSVKRLVNDNGIKEQKS